MALALEVYGTCCSFPPDERFGLAGQLKRAVVSIPSNIAEGTRRRLGPFLFHLEVAFGSQAEVEVQLQLAHRLGYIAETDYERLAERADKVGRMLNRLIEQLSRSTKNEERTTTNGERPESRTRR